MAGHLVATPVINGSQRDGRQQQHIVRAVVVTMFDGEFAPWREFFESAKELPFGWGPGPLMWDPRTAVLGVVTGVGTALAATTVTALICDERFDFSQAYWIVAGIAGGNPNRTSLGSVAVAKWVVDVDLKSEIDVREIPADWTTGRLPLFRQRPFEQPAGTWRGESWQLNPDLRTWAVQTASRVELVTSDTLTLLNRGYADYGVAQQHPRVHAGDCASGQTLWHGKKLTAWAEDWVTYWTDLEGHFATTSMEDTGTLRALHDGSRRGLLQWEKIILMRAVCNYCFQPAGMSAVESLSREAPSGYSAFGPAVTNAYLAARAVLDRLLVLSNAAPALRI